MNFYLTNKQAEFTKVIDFFKKDISTLRTGRINPSVMENVQVESYGSMMAVNALSNMNVTDGRSMTITPWDKTVLKEIEKAIIKADLGMSVVNEGDKLRVSVPLLTEENRKELVKKLGTKLEEARISLRQVRDEVKKEIETAFVDKAIAEDDKFRFLEELENEMDKRHEELKGIKEGKEKEIMTI